MAARSHITTITAQGQIAIPQDIREALGLHEGDKVEVGIENRQVVVRSMTPAHADWRSLEGAFGHVTETTEELLAEARAEEFEKERRLG